MTVKQECVSVFTEIKLGHKYRYVVYALTDDLKQIHVLKTAPPSTYIIEMHAMKPVLNPLTSTVAIWLQLQSILCLPTGLSRHL